MQSLKIVSPAKVNLFLRIRGRRKDGYHELETVFHRIALADELTLTKRKKGIRIDTNSNAIPTDSRNLIWKAHQALQLALGRELGVSVKLIKRIPVGGGLGGGSSNAACFLLGMNRLYHLSLTRAQLIKIGSKLGADVAFFLLNQNQAFGSGIGDHLMPHSMKRKLWFVIVTFPVNLSTRLVYQTYAKKMVQAAFLTKEKRVVRLPACFKTGELLELGCWLRNDLEPVSAKLYPPIKKTLELFDLLGVRTRLMSGSGATVFAVTNSIAQARLLAKRVKSRLRFYKNIFISHTF